ncbi:hypothetical protein [Schlesneria sp. DSM 10557]|uniref:hypothetical protein n=1 Tax=Schlesneria sp. DSM 10557 TaxID=3044399 RepID=UPI0035A135F8
MSIERAEKLKELLTDKFVVVDASVPELRRFENWTGKVRTVNMNCRALVEFDGPVDIGWYDIDPDYLKVVDAPVKKAPPAAKTAPAAKPPVAAGAPSAAPKPAAAGKSPLDAIRAQQSAKAAAASSAAPTAAPGKPSPLDMIRKQQAAKAAAAAAAPAESVATPAPTAAAPEAAVAEPVPAEPVVTEAASAPAPAAPAAVPTTGPDGRPLSKLEIIRMQQAAKKGG